MIQYEAEWARQEAAGSIRNTFSGLGSNVLFFLAVIVLISKWCVLPPADLHNRDPSNAAGPRITEAAELWHAHRGAVPSKHGNAGGAGGRRGLRGDSGRHPRRVLQVRQRPLHRDPSACWRCGSSWLWKSKPCVCRIHFIFTF